MPSAETVNVRYLVDDVEVLVIDFYTRLPVRLRGVTTRHPCSPT